MNDIKEFNRSAAMLASYWTVPQFTDADRRMWFTSLMEYEPGQVEAALVALSRDASRRYRPIPADIHALIQATIEPKAPEWTKARSMIKRAFSNAERPSNYFDLTREGGEGWRRIRRFQLKRLSEADWGHRIVSEWLAAYGINEYIHEGEGEDQNWVDKRRRESYERWLLRSGEDAVVETVLAASTPRRKEVGPVRRLDQAQALPAVAEAMPGEACGCRSENECCAPGQPGCRFNPPPDLSF